MSRQLNLDSFIYKGKPKLESERTESRLLKTQDTNSILLEESHQREKVQLLKLPDICSDSGQKVVIANDKLWYLKELFPAIDESHIKDVIKSSSSLDEAETKLLTLCQSTVVDMDAEKPAKQKLKRIRLMSDSSNDEMDPYSNRSPEAKRRAVVSNDNEEVTSLGTSRSLLQSNQRVINNSNGSGAITYKHSNHQLPDNYKEEEEDYDNDEDLGSDEEIVSSRKKQETILKFFNEASIDDIIRMPRCKEKKAETIINSRPYDSWEDLKKKFSRNRLLGLETIENCKELIEIRQVVLDLMDRCELISSQMSSHVNKLTESDDLGKCHIKVQPSLLNPNLHLKPYQMIGLNWLLLMYQQKVDGILADEMGLGKTSQSIAFLAYLLEHGNQGPHLIIVPSSTLDNWATELRRWCPALKFLVYHGSKEDRTQLRMDIFNKRIEFNIILSTYNVLTASVEDKQIYKRLEFQYAIIDEAHMLKNMTTQRYKNLMKIQAVRRLLLTGTPFQNDLVELMSLLCFVMPHMFVNKEDQLKKMFTSIAKKTDTNEASFETERIVHAKNLMKPFILRRLKKDVLKDLPQKNSSVEMVPLSTTQKEIYASLAKKISSGCQLAKMDALTQLRFAANHHLLLRWKYTDTLLKKLAYLILTEPTHSECNEQYVFEDMQVMNDFELHNLCLEYSSLRQYALPESDILSSGKFCMLNNLLPAIKAKGEKVLIFTQYQLMLNILEKYLQAHQHSYLRLDGSTPTQDRLAMIDEFNTNSSIFVFILSTKAGGLGINLTSANNVIIHDIDFNPHNDRQAEDRSHRLGQERAVAVTKLVSADTVEVAMLQVANRKLDLEKQIQDEDGTNEDDVDAVSMLQEALAIWTQHN